MDVREALKRHRDEFVGIASDSTFIVFLCGPKLKSSAASSRLRKRLKKRLEIENFEVVLGEDDGLDNPLIHKIGINAQDNELAFIEKRCNAVVIVADSVGSFCELALFSWHFVHKNGVIDKEKTDCIVFLDTVFERSGSTLSVTELADFLAEQSEANRLVRLNPDGIPFYSLSLAGSYYLSADQRKTRDKFRAYLLRDAHRARFVESRGSIDDDLAGVSPAVDTSSGEKGRAANKLGRTAFGRRKAYGRPYWPRISRQFTKRTGQTRYPRDTFPSLLSFESAEQLRAASSKQGGWDYVGLGLCIGISPQLIWNIAHQQDRHYRSFEIPKRGGGSRLIESPRVFLKVIQWFLSDFVLDDLDCHESVHSFSFGRSIATNAERHVGHKYVGNVDIENFFGSITTEHVTQHLRSNGFENVEAIAIANLCTKGGRLPQGAPTSPVISNAFLYAFDTRAKAYCDHRGLNYSRYADDITISGSNRPDVAAALELVPGWLEPFALALNAKKTRIASSSGQQRVTGVVVNSAAAPPRTYRRKVRAMFHQAQKAPTDFVQKIPELGGALGFLKIFPKLINSNEVRAYEAVLDSLKAIRREQRT